MRVHEIGRMRRRPRGADRAVGHAIPVGRAEPARPVAPPDPSSLDSQSLCIQVAYLSMQILEIVCNLSSSRSGRGKARRPLSAQWLGSGWLFPQGCACPQNANRASLPHL
jgi:hypothetical protein